MAARRLNPLPATPFSGRGMIGRPVGWAVEALRKASFSAERVTEVSAEVYEVFLLTYLAVFLTWWHIACATIHLFAITRKEQMRYEKKHLLSFRDKSLFSSVEVQYQMCYKLIKLFYLYQHTS